MTEERPATNRSKDKLKKTGKGSSSKRVESATKQNRLHGGFNYRHWLLRVEMLIVIVIFVMMTVILIFVMPLLQRGIRNAKRQHDVGNIAQVLEDYYRQHKITMPLGDLVDGENQLADKWLDELYIYQEASFFDDLNRVSDKTSFYSSQMVSPPNRAALPDVDNLHIWFGHSCQTSVLNKFSFQDKPQNYATLNQVLKPRPDSGYVILYQLEKRQTVYECLEVDLGSLSE